MINLRSAQHIGRNHIQAGTNCQDALAFRQGNDYAVGVICDGCSEGAHSEVGAHLAAAYLVNYLYTYQVFEPHVPVNKLDAQLDRILDQLVDMQSIENYNRQVQFIKDYMLFTVVGFVWTPDEAMVFYAGDGTLIVDDKVMHLNVGNTPLYPAYKLIPHALENPATEIPPLTVLTYKNVKRIAIGSDAWKDEQDLIPRIWDTKHLQREINRLSNVEHRFKDDVSVIALEVIDESADQRQTIDFSSI